MQTPQLNPEKMMRMIDMCDAIGTLLVELPKFEMRDFPEKVSARLLESLTKVGAEISRVQQQPAAAEKPTNLIPSHV